MKKSLRLAIIFIVTVLVSLPFAFGIVDSQRESVVITEEILSGDPKAAEGVTVEYFAQWDALALWNTRYTIGTGETVTEFFFEGDGVTWPKEKGEYLEFNIPVNFGTAVAVGESAGATRGVDLEGTWIPEVLRDVAERTKPGETRTEIICLADYYEYYPLELSVRSEEHNMSFYSNGVDYFSDFFRVKVPADEKVSVTIGKNEAGIVTDVECNSGWEGADGWQEDGLSIDTAYAFGEEACLFTYVCTDWDTGERVHAEENTGIFYAPYVEENRRFTIPGHVKKVSDIPEDILPVEMLWDEERNELYLAAKAGGEYRLYIYSVVGETVALKQELVVLQRGDVLETEKDDVWQDTGFGDEAGLKQLPYYREMTLEDGGILIKWTDGYFSFVAEAEDGYELWCSDIFVPGVQGMMDTVYDADGMPVEIGYKEDIFSYEHALMFDGKRLVLASYDSWQSLNVTLAVYNSERQLYCGRYHHSTEADKHLAGLGERIYAQGTTVGSNRRSSVVFQPLRVWVE